MSLGPKFSLSDPAYIENPYPIYSDLRNANRTARGGLGQIVFPHYRDVADLLKSNKLGNEFPPQYRNFSMGDGVASDFLSRVILHRDAPIHQKLRHLVGGPMMKTKLPHLAKLAEEIATELIDEALANKEFEAMSAIAQPLPILMICEILGVPSSDRARLRPHAIALGKAFKLDASLEDRKTADVSIEILRNYMRKAILKRDTHTPHNEFLTQAKDAVKEDITLTDVIDNLIFLFFAGFETTTSLIGTMISQLATHPIISQKLRTNPKLISNFIEECLRYEPPIQSRARLIKEPIKIGDKIFRAGRIAVLLIGSANRDSEVFEDPETFNFMRSPNPHLSFGAGPHFCLGYQLAKMEAKIVLKYLLERCDSLEMPTLPTYDLDSVFRCHNKLTVNAKMRS